MYNGGTISLKKVLWKVMNSSFMQDLSYEVAAELAVEAIRLIGTTLSYENKTTRPLLKIIDHKALLPKNHVLTRGVRAFFDADGIEGQGIAMTTATDIYHASEDCSDCGEFGFELTYEIQSGVITTSFADGYVEVAYQALPLDEDGFPLIPDNQDFLMAIEYYIRFRVLEGLWEAGKVTDKVFNYIDTKKCFYMGAAQSDMQFANMDHVEAAMNSINRIIINSHAQRNFFKFMGKHERLKKF
ncbi:MAG: hypothetical protein ACSLE0_23480 [Chitinophagaceae bacterium]